MRVMIAVASLNGKVTSAITRFMIGAERLNHDSRSMHSFIFRILDNRAPTIFARNLLVGEFLKSDAEALWFIDDDMLPPQNAFELLDVPGDIISGACFVGKYSKGNVMFGMNYNAYMDRGGDEFRFVPIEPDPVNPVMDIDAVGTACMLIHRRVFINPGMWPDGKIDMDSMAPKMFYHDSLPDGRPDIGNDLLFCRRARACGYSVKYHLGVEFGHVKMLDLSSVTKMLSNYIGFFGQRPDELEKVQKKALAQAEKLIALAEAQ